MRYREDHAASSGSVPLALRGRKSARTVLTIAVSAAIGLVPALAYSSPAMATAGDLTFGAVQPVMEGAVIHVPYTYTGAGADYDLSTEAVGGPNAVDATEGAQADYDDPTTPLSIAQAGSGTIDIQTHQDQKYEGPEQFVLVATETLGGGDEQRITLTINDDDVAPTVTLTGPNGAVAEPATGNAYSTGTANAQITATLSGNATERNTVVNLNTVDGTAKAGTGNPGDPVGDYVKVDNGQPVSITIPAGSPSGTANVVINGDATKDSATTEQFSVVGTSTGISNSPQTASVSITDATGDTATPKLTLTGNGPQNSADGAEGGNSVFKVVADHASDAAMGATWTALDAGASTAPATPHGVATPGTDFTYPASAANRTVSIAPGETSVAMPSIALTSDNVYDPNEDFTIGLSLPTNADLGTTVTKKATIADANQAPAVNVTPTTVTEGNDGTKNVTFTATLTQSSTQTIKANWATDDGTAVSGLDYVRTSGTLTFAPGTTTQTFTVGVIGDTVDEGTGETFDIDTWADDDSLSDNTSTLTITDDDSAPTVTFENLKVPEGNDPAALLVPVKLSNASDHPISFDLTRTGGIASGTFTTVAGSGDYTMLNDEVTVPAGQTSGYAVILVNGDMMYEPDETLDLNVAAQAGTDGQNWLTAPYTKSGTVTLTNDDKAPELAINNVSGKEGDTVPVTATVHGSAQDPLRFSILFTGQASGGMTAADASDFTNPGAKDVWISEGTPEGAQLDIAKVQLTDDTVKENDESIVVSGVAATNNTGTVKPGVITIQASDGGTPSQPGNGNGKLTITAPKNIVGAVAVSIKGMAPADGMVDLWGAPMGAGGELKKLLSTKADAKGNYAFSRWIGEGYRFAVASGDDKSDEVTVTVTQNPVFVASSTAKGVLSLAVQGNPRESGQTAIVQRLVSGKWVNAWRGTTGSDNIWRGSAKIASGTKVTVRAFVAGYTPDGLLPGYTAAKVITIK